MCLTPTLADIVYAGRYCLRWHNGHAASVGVKAVKNRFEGPIWST